ncbi:hypothetical protein AB6A40_001738 [Gnathostoma spinigerum]|uniref:DNA/RNA-binding domain-containing protein n=1 Tax=Gnathostoma spinigerum TaxID=75299 RepID=A0ABD6E4V5_9BILA
MNRAEEIWSQIEKLQKLNVEMRSQYNYRVPLLQLYEALFVADLSFALEKNVDCQFFLIQKEILDELKGHLCSKSNSRSYINGYRNALFECSTELKELCLLVQQKYDFRQIKFPVMLTVREDTELDTGVKLCSAPNEHLSRFAHFICLRMGDIARYQHNYRLAREMYKAAIRIAPTDGQAWNQIGLIEVAEKRLVDALYCYSTACGVKSAFSPALDNREKMLEKYITIKNDEEESNSNSIILSLIANCRFPKAPDQLLRDRITTFFSSWSGNYEAFYQYFVILASIYEGLDNDDGKGKTYELFDLLISKFYSCLLKKCLEMRHEGCGIQFLSLLWLYMTWIKAANISLKIKDDFAALSSMAELLDSIQCDVKLSTKRVYLDCLSFIPYEEASLSSLSILLSDVFWRILGEYKITSNAEPTLMALVEALRVRLSSKRRPRVSRTVPILSSLESCQS